MSVHAHKSDHPTSGPGGDTGDDSSGPRGVTDGTAAARLLAMTARDTDQWRSEAKAEAAAVVAGAREEAAKLVRDAREEAERLLSSARDEAAQTVNDARVEAYRVREKTTAVRKRHDEDVASLQQVATDHREQLRHHLTTMLEQVNSIPGGNGP